MTLTFDVVGTAPDRVKADLLAVPVFPGGLLGPGADVVDTALGGTLAAFMTEAGFEAKRGEALAVPTSGRLGAKAAVLVGMGERDTLDVDALRRAGAAVARRASKVVKVATTVLDAAPDSIDRGDAAQGFVEGVALGSYQFLTYKSDAKPSKLARVQILGRANANVRDGIERGARIAAAVAWARDLVNEPAADKSPDAIAKLTRALARANGLTIKVLAGEQLEKERLGGVLGVGKGSERPPRFVRLAYEPKGARATLAFVGKGVVFDSGGLSLKTASGMETMKTDMSGGAAVIAAMSTLRDLDVKIRVIGFVPLVENMPSGDAMRPGDVLRMRNGKTVEVLNTDAEGRLILADALSLASEEKPDAIVDLATLTGACVVALGEKVAGLMGEDAWVEQIRAAAGRAGEAVWHLPLPPEYRKMIDSEVADIKNISGAGGGGALTAGLFLREFSGDVPWAHLDIAGPARAGSDDGYIVRGGTGFGVRTLVELARTFKAPKT
ncbi:MAG TPA: leucyl aminopeptidase [Acidimicrobiia bacterium]|jgi:leucyl aminopeptidase|nr:leucyl aminopeptidase [Acidimicrobiia bacterium]